MRGRLRGSVGAVLVVLGCLGAPALTGCDFFLGPTKTARGQLYQSGNNEYDPYFSAVHAEQVAANKWPDDSKASRRPIVTALDLRPGASNATILSAVRGKRGDASLASAVEQTTSSEAERARRLSVTAKRLVDMRERGDELKKQAAKDRENMGANKADDKKVAKKEEVKREMAAAVDALDSMASDARKGVKEAEELATKLRAAWSGNAADERPRAPETREERADKEEKREQRPAPAAKKPAKSSAKKPPGDAKPAEEKSAPKREAPAPAEGEVFNP